MRSALSHFLRDTCPHAVDSPWNSLVICSLKVPFVVSLKNVLKKHSKCHWFETQWGERRRFLLNVIGHQRPIDEPSELLLSYLVQFHSSKYTTKSSNNRNCKNSRIKPNGSEVYPIEAQYVMFSVFLIAAPCAVSCVRDRNLPNPN